MKDQINTIRSELTSLHGIVGDLSEALAALSELESSLAQYEAGDVASAAAQGFRDGVASVAQQPQALTRDRIREIFMAHGFTIKDGQTDLKEYVYEAAAALLAAAQQPQAECAHRWAGSYAVPDDARCVDCGAWRKQPQAEVVWVNPELEHMAEEAECVSMCLNDRGVPSKDGSKPLSLWGRVQQYANPRFLEGMTTNTPIISSEHIKALAQVCRLIGNYTTAEFVQNVVGFAQVLLANKAVQEAFVKANAHLLYAAPQQAEAVPSDVVRDAERYRWLAARPNEWRLFRKHGKHKLPFRMMRDGDPWGQSFASADEAIDAAIAAQGAKT